MNNDWLDIGVLEDYLDGKLDAKTMNRVEREALEDPFVAEALEGLSRSPKRSLQSISLLQKQLHERISEQHQTKKRSVITWQRLSIAAAAAVMFVSVSIMFWMKENNRQQQMAARPKKVDVNMALADTVEAKTDSTGVLAKAKNKPEPVDVSSEIDRAIAAAKTNAYASNKKIKPAGPLNRKEDLRAMRGSAAEQVPAPLAAKQMSSAIEAQMADRITIPATEKATDTNRSLKEVAVTAYAPPQAKRVAQASTIQIPAQNITRQSILRGRVISAADGQAIYGAVVQVEGTPYQTVTDLKGQFNLLADSSALHNQINVSSIGYQSQAVNSKPQKPVMIRLNESQNALNEVVTVSGAILAASPVGGWEDFMAYLIKHNRLTQNSHIGAKVEVGFTIARNGKPKDIKVVKGLSEACDQEAVRLISEGPKWIRPTKGSAYTTVLIGF